MKRTSAFRQTRFILALAVAILCAAVLVTVCFTTEPLSDHDTMRWAQTLLAEDVDSIELEVGHFTGKRSKDLAPIQIQKAVKWINLCHGNLNDDPVSYTGGYSISFEITMKDGSRHSVYNDGNMYIDHNCYAVDQDLLMEWIWEWMYVAD